MTFEAVKQLVAKAAFSDSQPLVKAGLQQLSDKYAAYPMMVDGETLLVLIKRGLSPKSAAGLPEAEASKGNVLVLKKGAGGNWEREWPSP